MVKLLKEMNKFLNKVLKITNLNFGKKFIKPIGRPRLPMATQ